MNEFTSKEDCEIIAVGLVAWETEVFGISKNTYMQYSFLSVNICMSFFHAFVGSADTLNFVFSAQSELGYSM